MELIVISDTDNVVNEADIINRLFEAGMKRFHLRKLQWDIEKSAGLLAEIDKAYHQDIVLHQHHQLAKVFGINRLHYKEKERRKTEVFKLLNKTNEGDLLSTSVHSLAEIPSLQCFEYVFFSPVFNSLSKPGYQSQLTEGFRLQKDDVNPKVIALGGIDDSNLDKIKEMNFDGAAVLGSIWSRPEQAVFNFKRLKELANN